MAAESVTPRKSTVIKAASMAGTERLRPQSFHLADVMREAEDRMAAVMQQAAEVLHKAEAGAAGIRAAAREEGRREGYEAGLREGCEKGRVEALTSAGKEFAAQQKSLIAMFTQAIDRINAERIAWKAAARQDLVDLAMAIARRVAKHVGERERQVVLANLEEAVRLAGVRSEVTIAVNPKDAETARLFADSLADMHEQWEHVRIVEETEVSAGGCRVQWGSGAVDAALETQLDRIAAELQSDISGAAAQDEGPERS